MKKLVFVALLTIGGITAVSAQTKPVAKAKTANCEKSTSCAKTASAKKGTKPSCCKNEKAMSALRRPVAKPLTDKKAK